jgi:chromosome segregation ATPase
MVFNWISSRWQFVARRCKVIKMVDDMVALLKKEQQDDDDKTEMCEMQLDKAEDDLKVLETTVADLEKSIADGKAEIVTFTDEIAALTKGLAALDKQVEEAMVNRKEENEDYQSLKANNGAALEIIGMAKNRLNKFYNPAMCVAPASFIQLHKQADDEAPAPPHETFGAYAKQSEGSNGVIAVIDSLVADLEKEMQEAELEEKDSQGDYEQFTRDAADKRVMDSKSITEKDGAKADAEVNLVTETKERQTKMKEALATVDYIGGVHKDCDWLLQNYDVRKQARVGEGDALTKAKAVLSGADFSLVQTNSKFLRVRK